MSDHAWFITAMVIYLIAMLLIGLYGYKQTDQYEDYMLGGRQLHPFVAALSAGASDMSGWLLMGLPAAIFVSGFSKLWVAIGLLIGAALNWWFTAPRLRTYTEVANNSITLPTFLEHRLEDRKHVLRVVAGLVILVFFTFYVASGMVAGGRYFESTFGASYLWGMIIIAGVTVVYTFIGGFLAVSYTDAVQGTIMFFALLMVPVMAFITVGDSSSLFDWQLNNGYGNDQLAANPDWFSLFSGVSAITVISGLAWGLGYFGQPHIIVRFMALRKPSDAKQGLAYGVSWMALSMVGAVFVAVMAPGFFAMDPSISIVDQVNFETIFLDMGRILFHPLIAGLVLTAVLAAIMSTISSQLLVVSSALVEDMYKGLFNKKASDNQLKLLSRIAVVLVAVMAFFIARNPDSAVLKLVEFAWAGFGSAFGPVVIASLYWRRLNVPGAVAGVLAGALVAFVWGGLPTLGVWVTEKPFGLYEMVPGVLASIVAMVVVSLATKPPAPHVVEMFDEVQEISKTMKGHPEADLRATKEGVEAHHAQPTS
ncbi:sodium/proline symporter PutP [Corynebacterium heidelbergense]|uniref:Sodium/proline symporter n=1 Tax=Corynebacterium heidelbergense TaxID=2055947 RepID=A0A364VDW3_9CORY|nr:sodium/proline symporter PutP [Corynebacterium heidelbergense]RAV34839.1 sodium/proline symporter PutP [Corynebacterium heidelbergense]WCZ36919.1 Sodium/proline symporter [Corynebacterium heidelbergense]